MATSAKSHIQSTGLLPAMIRIPEFLPDSAGIAVFLFLTMAKHALNVLLVEDDAPFGVQLRRGLIHDGYRVDWKTNLTDAERQMQCGDYALIILDWMLPDGEGVHWLKTLRMGGTRIPVILLTARSQIEDKVHGLDAGADDYLAKPFALAELLARMRTLLRRVHNSAQQALRIGSLTLDPTQRKVLDPDGNVVELTPKEFDLLAFLLSRRGDAIGREKLAREVWQADNRFTSMDNLIDVHMANLRRKLKQVNGIDPITTVRGLGFRLQSS